MASTGPSHPSFANRPYSSTHGKLPERTAAGFAQTHTGSGNNARIERERQDRDRGGREAQSSAQGGSGAQNPLSSITDEQREEINEAVRQTLRYLIITWRKSSRTNHSTIVRTFRPRQRPADRLP
jgi:hypothetical protein